MPSYFHLFLVTDASCLNDLCIIASVRLCIRSASCGFWCIIGCMIAQFYGSFHVSHSKHLATCATHLSCRQRDLSPSQNINKWWLFSEPYICSKFFNMVKLLVFQRNFYWLLNILCHTHVWNEVIDLKLPSYSFWTKYIRANSLKVLFTQ